MAGSLTVFTGGMFAEKSTALIREGKRHLIAGRKVVFLKPANDDRYADDSVVTHDGTEHKAINIDVEYDYIFDKYFFFVSPEENHEINSSEIICIDEIQFFPEEFLKRIDSWIYRGKQVFVAGLDLDRFGEPFGIIPELMARAETVKKFHAVCGFCGNDAWVSLGTENLNNNNQVNVGNEYVPACRTCAEKEGGIK